MMRLTILVLSTLVLAACAGTPPVTSPSPFQGGLGKPCPSGQGSCFTGGNYPATHLAEGGNPDKGNDSDGGAASSK